jgi:hypothetical protein
VTERIGSIEKSNDLVGIGTRDHPACSIAPQPNYATTWPSFIVNDMNKQIHSLGDV